jgi:hypothetical protein
VLHNPISRKRLAGVAAIFLFVGGIILAILEGVVSNVVYTLLPSLLANITKSIQANLWPWIITLIVFFLGLSGWFLVWLQGRRLKYALNATHQIVKLDDEMLRQLASSLANPDLDKEIQRLLERLLQNATEAFPEDAYRASILLPDANKEYLQMRASIRCQQKV